jgi:hypothetical protein
MLGLSLNKNASGVYFQNERAGEAEKENITERTGAGRQQIMFFKYARNA